MKDEDFNKIIETEDTEKIRKVANSVKLTNDQFKTILYLNKSNNIFYFNLIANPYLSVEQIEVCKKYLDKLEVFN